MIKKIPILLLLVALNVPLAHAAFPIKSKEEIHNVLPGGENNVAPAQLPSLVHRKSSFISRIFSDVDGHRPAKRKRHTVTIRSRSMASVMAFIGIYPGTGVVMGMHRFYLGYTWQGCVQFFAPYVCGALIFLAFISGITIPLAVSFFCAGFVGFMGDLAWQIADYIRIRARTLQPKWGYYKDDVERVTRDRRD